MLSATTELDAINTMLSSIGEAPVNTVEDSGVVDAVMAHQILTSVSREVQSRGWHFNTDKSFPLVPTYPDKELLLPPTVLRVDTVDRDASIDVCVRGTRLYNRRTHSYSFDRMVYVDMVILLSFNDLPEPARHFITVRSARIFQERLVGSGELSQFSSRDETRALVVLQEMEADTADYNILTDNYSVARILDR
jgi:hypothetical protein